jgi:hypothetical protein
MDGVLFWHATTGAGLAASSCGVAACNGALNLRNWVLLLGLAAVLSALVLASGHDVVTEAALRANASLAGEIFTIPLAATVRREQAFFSGARNQRPL